MKKLLATTALTLGMMPFAWAGEAPTGFDNLTNGFIDQSTFDANRAVFEEVETPADGLGPTFNNSGCRNCHDRIVTGGSGSITELRAGSRRRHGGFVEAAGGTLIASQALDPSIVESVGPKDNVRALRITTNILGDGFVEAVRDSTLLAIRNQQPTEMRGLAVMVDVLEIPGLQRVGRFGWKDQHASLKSFAADAYLNEMGITTPLFPVENTSNGRSVAAFDTVPDPEDDGDDVDRFADFMRATKAPPRNRLPRTTTGRGEDLFTKIQCAVCHTPSMTTASARTVLPGQVTPIGTALGDKTIHPYSDFLLHDVGTGDGIPMSSDHPETSFTMRTAPLWGLHTRKQLMHDGGSTSVTDAVHRHGGQATKSRQDFDNLKDADKIAVLTFLNSL